MGKKDMNEGWGTYNGKSRKSASWGDEIKGGWDLGGSSSISFSASKGNTVQKQSQVDGDLSWGGDVKRKQKGGWFDTHDGHREGDKKDAVDKSVSWGGASNSKSDGWGGFLSAESSGWGDTHDGHRDGDKKDAVDSSVSWGGASNSKRGEWGGFLSAESSGWSDTHDDHQDGDKKDAVDSSVSWGGASNANGDGWGDTLDAGSTLASGGRNRKLKTNVTVYRTPYDKAHLAHKIRKNVVIIAVAIITILMWVNVSLVASLIVLFILCVLSFIYVVVRCSEDEMYQSCFIEPYVKTRFGGTYHDSFSVDFGAYVSSFSDTEVINAWKDFKLLSLAQVIAVKGVIDGKISNLPVRIYSFAISVQEGDTLREKPGLLIKLPLKGFVINPIEIRKIYGDYLGNQPNVYSIFDLEIKSRINLLNRGTLDDDNIDIEDMYGERIQSEEFLHSVSEAFKLVKTAPMIYFNDNYAYLHMRVPDVFYSTYKHAEKYREIEKLDEETATFLPLCEALLSLDNVFGVSGRALQHRNEPYA